MKEAEKDLTIELNRYFPCLKSLKIYLSSFKSKDCLTVKPTRELTFKFNKNKYSSDLSLLNKTNEPVLFKVLVLYKMIPNMA